MHNLVDKLKACLSLRKQIKEINEKIYEFQLKMMSPKNQIITGMPHAKGNNDVAADRYLIRLEELETTKKALIEEINTLWRDISVIFEKHDIKPYIIELFFLRFYKGLSWKVCAKRKQWNENKCFRIYRSTLDKINK